MHVDAPSAGRIAASAGIEEVSRAAGEARAEERVVAAKERFDELVDVRLRSQGCAHVVPDGHDTEAAQRRIEARREVVEEHADVAVDRHAPLAAIAAASESIPSAIVPPPTSCDG